MGYVTNMKIWLVTVGEPLPIDREQERLYRTGLLANFLSMAKHEVVWWTSNFNHAKKCRRANTQESIKVNEYLKINLLDGVGYRSNLSLMRIINHMTNAFDFKKKSNKYEKPDIIICGYPTIELSYQVVKYGLTNNLPVIIDIRDLWPESIINIFPKFVRSLMKIVLFWSFYQSNFIFRHSTSLMAVSSKYLQYGLNKAKRSFEQGKDLVAPIGYQKTQKKSLEEAKNIKFLSDLNIEPTRFICWFVGYFGQTYDINPIIQVAKILKEREVKDVVFILSGTGDKYHYWLEKAKKYDNILFTGWVNKDQLEVLGNIAKVGLQAYADKAPQGLANKLFEYLSFGLPVLSSLKGENEELIHEHGVGFTYDVKNPQSFLEKLMILYNDPALLQQMSHKAKELMAEKFDNARINQSIEKHIRQVIEQHE